MTNNKAADSRRARLQMTLLRAVVYFILIVLTILCLFSFYMLIINATRSNAQLQGGFTALPQGHFLDNLRNAWTDASINIPRGMINSFFIAASTAVLTTYFSALTAYGIHAYDFKLKRALPGIAAPVVFFYMKQYMESVLPMEIVEAARMDGSNEFRTFNTIVLPMLRPAIAVQMIFSFVASWNNYFLPALLLTKAEYKTVPIMIAQLRSADYSKFDMGKVYMFILLAILPVLIVYIILSKSIIKGVTAGSVKG